MQLIINIYMKKIILSLLLLFNLSLSFAQSGQLDPLFGNNGIVNTSFGATSGDYLTFAKQVLTSPDGNIYLLLNEAFISKRFPNGVIDSAYGFNGFSTTVSLTDAAAALQADGKILIVGSRINDRSFIIARLNTNGTPDSSFGNNGVKSILFKDPAYARSVALQTDGKIVVAGYTIDINSYVYFAVARYNTNGSVDNSFNGNGQTITDFEFKIPPQSIDGDTIELHNAYAYTVAIQPNNKIVLGGYANTPAGYDFAIARYNTNGKPDSSFGTNGKQTTDFGSTNDIGYSLAIQPDAKIILAGYSSTNTTNHFCVARYDSLGQPDNSFNGNGKQTTDVGSDELIGNSAGLQSNGKILVAGYTQNGGLNDFAVVRFNINGTIDNTFNGTGTVTTDFNNTDDYAGSIAIQSDDKILVAGYSFINYPPNITAQHLAVARYNSDGSLDNSFANGGKLSGDSAQKYTRFNATAIQADGKVLAAGYAWNGNNYDFAVIRYTVNGIPDTSFGNNGILLTDFGSDDEAGSIALQPDGKIIVGGFTGNVNHQFAVARYTVNGSLDNTFNGNGLQAFPMGYADIFGAVALQPDGKIVMAGSTYTDVNYDSAFFAIARLNNDGSPDNTFGTNGKQLNQLQSSASFAYSVAIQKDTQIVAAGRVIINGQNNFALIRYTKNGSLDTTFSNDGMQSSVVGSDAYTGQGVAIEPDGKIVLAGYRESLSGGTSSFAMARYNIDGSLDSGFGNSGFQTTDISSNLDLTNAIAINSDGRIAVGGSDNNFAVVLYKINGTPDSTFGINGIQTNTIGLGKSAIRSLAFANNKLYAAGNASFPGADGVVARYLIVSQGPLPVSLFSFTAILQSNKTVALNWQTLSEQSLSGFTVERSADGTTFAPIAYVTAKGNSSIKQNYSAIDPQPLYAINFYRLKITDIDGKITYSKTVSINIDDNSFTLKLSPNPTKNTLFVKAGGDNEKGTFIIYDVSGRKMQEIKVDLNGATSFSIDVNNLPAGIYNLQLQTISATYTKRFIKE